MGGSVETGAVSTSDVSISLKPVKLLFWAGDTHSSD